MGHRVVIEFDDGIRAKLICPESGCTPAGMCSECYRDLTDEETAPCYDCKDAAHRSYECWIKTWFDNVGADELLAGKIEVGIDAEWDMDHMIAHVVGPVTAIEETPNAA